MQGSSRWFSWLVFLFFGSVLASSVYTAASDGWPVNARIFPLGAGIVGVLLAAVELAVPHVAWLRERLLPRYVMDLVVAVEEGQTEAEVKSRALAAFAWLFCLLGAAYLLGFPAAAALFMLAYLRKDGRLSWRQALLSTVCVWVIVFGGFSNILNIPWPKPLLLEWYEAASFLAGTD